MSQSGQPIIVYIGGFELPDRNAATQRVVNNARILRALGYRTLLVGVSRDRPCDGQLYPADSGEADFEAWETGYPRNNRQWLKTIVTDAPLRLLPRQAKFDPGDVVAVICYNHPAVAQARIAHLARSWGAAAVADCTEWYATRSWTSAANIVKNIDTAMRMRLINPSMDGLITTSAFMTDFYGGKQRPILEVPTLIEPTREDTESAVLRHDGAISLFTIGPTIPEWIVADDIHDRIDWIVDLLDEVAARGERFVLTVAGMDRDRYLAIFPHHRAMIDRLGSAIRFLGRIPRAELLRLQEQAAFAMILRSDTRVTRAGYPTKYSEAISYGTPVVANGIMSIAPYQRNGRTGFTIDLADREQSITTLLEIVAMTDEEILGMKQYCRSCGLLAPNAFEGQTRAFLNALAA